MSSNGGYKANMLTSLSFYVSRVGENLSEKKHTAFRSKKKSAWASLDKKLAPSIADLPIQRIINHMNILSQITK